MPLARVQGALGGLYGIESLGFKASLGSEDKCLGAAVAKGEEEKVAETGDLSWENWGGPAGWNLPSFGETDGGEGESRVFGNEDSVFGERWSCKRLGDLLRSGSRGAARPFVGPGDGEETLDDLEADGSPNGVSSLPEFFSWGDPEDSLKRYAVSSKGQCRRFDGEGVTGVDGEAAVS
jgi:hypothetical protein